MPKKGETKPATFDPEKIRDLSVEIYKARLEHSCRGDTKRMLEKDAEKDPNDNGKKLRGRAGFYDQLTRAYLELFGFSPENMPTVPK